MRNYDLLRELSYIDEKLLMEPRKFVSVRLNLLLGLLAANISALIPRSRPVLEIFVFLLTFGAMYAFATCFLNRRRKLLSSEEKSDPE